MPRAADIDRVLAAVEGAADEIVGFASDLIRVPTINPPGEAYGECARLVGDRLTQIGFDVEYCPARDCPEHTARHPRINVVGLRRGRALRPCVHLNGHLDVVPAGAGWTVDPFAGVVRDGRIYGRGACDMKSGIAAAVFAAEAIRRAGVNLAGSVAISGTVDEESGGFAGAGWLAERRRLSIDRIDYVIIPEPLDVDRICIGHRGVYWFELTTHGRTGHGSMPFLAVSAIDHMGRILNRMEQDLRPLLERRTTSMPVVPHAARHATLNVNGIAGGQPVDNAQTPCVADRCRAVFDRRFLPEEGFETVRGEIAALVASVAADTPSLTCEIRDLLVVQPVCTPQESPLISVLEESILAVLGRPAARVASPGTYDHKHVERIGGIRDCVAYGPGRLEMAHQPDEWCSIEDLVNATKVLALSILALTEAPRGGAGFAGSPAAEPSRL
jgi:succinyl-diaminopimelate desuccinylase